jgi:ribose transport system ATP-binding protein
VAGLARISVRGVHKAFGATQALRGVHLQAEAGEVLAVLGENGAGKSTLMSVLSGATLPDAGEMRLDGALFAPRGPADARAAGVAIVHQEPTLCPHLSVAENLLLGIEPARFGVVRRAEARTRVQELLAQVAPSSAALPQRGLHESSVQADTIVRDLSPPDQQLVSIARALGGCAGSTSPLPAVGGCAGSTSPFPTVGGGASCRVLILDEPTSSLAHAEVERLFELVRSLKKGGIAILYISHFLEEVRAIADRFTVLRDGKSVGAGTVADTELGEMVAMMAGRAVEQLFPRHRRGIPPTPQAARTPGGVALLVKGVSAGERVAGASLTVSRGEVFGIAGLVGAGRTELLRAIFGLDPTSAGEVHASGTMGLLSEDRKNEGLCLPLSLADNVTLSSLPRFVSPAAQRRSAVRWISELSVVCRSPEQPAADLSGGNQQKTALARLLEHDVDVLLLDEPTRGIDVGAKAQIYALIDHLAARGKAVLVVSSYFPELLGICDRIAVMCRGRLGEARPASKWDEHSLLAEATGSSV